MMHYLCLVVLSGGSGNICLFMFPAFYWLPNRRLGLWRLLTSCVSNALISSNAINHLASMDHLKNLKGFLWKHGGGMDRVDSFRISEADLAKVYSLKTSSLLFFFF